MANCWVCQTKMPQGSAESCKGACSACHGRLRKKFGSKQWEEVAREAIKMGKREIRSFTANSWNTVGASCKN